MGKNVKYEYALLQAYEIYLCCLIKPKHYNVVLKAYINYHDFFVKM